MGPGSLLGSLTQTSFIQTGQNECLLLRGRRVLCERRRFGLFGWCAESAGWGNAMTLCVLDILWMTRVLHPWPNALLRRTYSGLIGACKSNPSVMFTLFADCCGCACGAGSWGAMDRGWPGGTESPAACATQIQWRRVWRPHLICQFNLGLQ